jgi:hypothetical protein
MQSDHERARRLIDEAVLAGLSKGDESWLHNHTRCCGDCVEYSLAMADVLRGLRSISVEVDTNMNQRVRDAVVARIRQPNAEPNQPPRIFDRVRDVIGQWVVRPPRQLVLTTAILAVLAAPLVYRAVRDKQRYTDVNADDQLLLDSIGANVSGVIPQALKPLMRPLSSD